MTLYRVDLYNRFSESKEEEFFVSRENADARVAEVESIYAEAEAKGSGIHWGNVIYDKYAYIVAIKTRD